MIRMMKSASDILAAGKPRIMIFHTAFMLASVVTIGTLAPSVQAQSGSRPIRNRPSRSQFLEERSVERQPKDESRSEISLAREKARDAKKKFESVKKLSRVGSASQKQLRDAELLKWLALLDLSNLVSPESKPKNSLLRAELVYNYRIKELDVIKKLYERGSASKLEYQRAKSARDVAKSQFKAVQSGSNSKRKIHVISAASSKYEEAEKVQELAAKLFQSGSLSQAAMNRANSNLKAAKSELSEAKESLGARAYEVAQ